MPEDDIFYFISTYGLWLLLALAVFKFIYLLMYRNSMEYAFKRYFRIYTDKKIVKEDPARYNFRLVHNSLTWALYAVLILWLIVTIIITE